MNTLVFLLLAGGSSAALPAQQAPPKPVRPLQTQSPSSLSYSSAPDGSETVEIRNVSYEVTGTPVPGRPPDERLLLRKITHSKKSLGDIGVEATVALEAWPLGSDIRQKPLYAMTVTGEDGRTLDNALFVASRGLEEVAWWSVYKLGSGQHVFDTYAPLVSFSISRENLITRYVGLQIPPDDEADARLKKSNVVGVLSYASEDRLIRELLVTCDDPRRARLLRSYVDTTRKLSWEEPHTLKVAFSQNYPSPPNTVELLVPLLGDDPDPANARLPAQMHVSSWRR